MARYYRVSLRNKRTNEVQLTLTTFTSRKKADEFGKEFCGTYMYGGKPKFEYEVKAF